MCVWVVWVRCVCVCVVCEGRGVCVDVREGGGV